MPGAHVAMSPDNSARRRLGWVLGLGLASLAGYSGMAVLGDLRAQTVGFVSLYALTFALYLAAAALCLRGLAGRWRWPVIWGLALGFRLVLLPMTPTLSDDMYRYVWDGRVQANGISPYAHPPNDPALLRLRSAREPIYREVYRPINRKAFVTVYPPGAQALFALSYQVVGASPTGFKAVFVLAELAGGLALLGLLRATQQPPERVLIYLWSPLLVVEVAHAGHVDALMLPFLVLALWARVRERPLLLGLALGGAIAIKLFPLLLLPALAFIPRPGGPRGSLVRFTALPFHRLAVFLGLALALLPLYALYWVWGNGVTGFLPLYFTENFNMGLARGLFALADAVGWPRALLSNAVTFGGLAVLGLYCMLRPADTWRGVFGQVLLLIGWFTLWTQNLFPWYLLWLLPLLTALLEPGRVLGFRLTPALAWLLFTGTSSLAYLFFIDWRINDLGQLAQFLPIYALLVSALRRQGSDIRHKFAHRITP